MASSDLLYYLSTCSSYALSTVQYSKIALCHVYRLAGPPLASLKTPEPDLFSVFMLVVILWLSLLIINQAVRMTYGIVAMAMKVAIVTAIAGSIIWVANQGVEEAGREVGLLARVLIEYFKNV
ncbi:hypothetical protein V1512DRAFT_162148 [Lipomyces arxii]|uniref:uncharacterized protein n=1 Tax=Lipomyces arxii TaxID=56418 RepID=UPI0034CD49DF